MNNIRSNAKRLCLCGLASILTACGGAGSGSSSTGTTAGSPPGTNPSPALAANSGVSGYVIDGYLSGASVTCDVNNSGVVNAGETTVTSAADGSFIFPSGCTSALIVTQGTNVDTGLSFTGTLRAQAGSTVVTPLTTLLALGMSQAQMNSMLGLTSAVDLTATDPAASASGTFTNPALMKAQLAMQQIIQKTAEMINALPGTGTSAQLPGLYLQVAQAVATTLQSGTTPLMTSGTLSAMMVQNLILAAVQHVASNSATSAEIRTKLSALSAASIASAASVGIASQAQAILNAPGTTSGLAAITRTNQQDTSVSSLLAGNTAVLQPSVDPIDLTILDNLTTSAVTENQGTSTAPTVPSTVSVDGHTYSLQWNDEFQYTGLPDPTKWTYDTYRNTLGWFNGELEYYSNARLENSYVANGVLTIQAIAENPVTAFGAADTGSQNYGYTSARLVTKGLASWTYGFFEVRAKLPCGEGTWPAIWTLSTGNVAWPASGELDLMEQTSTNKTTVLGTEHTTASGSGGTSANFPVSDACTNFHNYQMLWTPALVWIGVDGNFYNKYTPDSTGDASQWPFNAPQYLLLNIAIGGTLGTPVDSNFKADESQMNMQIQHVRVYQ